MTGNIDGFKATVAKILPYAMKAKKQMLATKVTHARKTCPECHGAGYTKITYVIGLKTGAQITLTACTCSAGGALKAQIAAMATPIPEGE